MSEFLYDIKDLWACSSQALCYYSTLLSQSLMGLQPVVTVGSIDFLCASVEIIL